MSSITPLSHSHQNGNGLTNGHSRASSDIKGPQPPPPSSAAPPIPATTTPPPPLRAPTQSFSPTSHLSIESGLSLVPTPSDITNWAPTDQLPAKSTGLPANWLPDFVALSGGGAGGGQHLRVGRDGVIMTSFNISVVRGEMEDSIRCLLSEKVFEELMNDPVGRNRFREYLVSTKGDVASFDFWVDLRHFSGLSKKIKNTSLALHTLYSISGERHQVSPTSLSSELREDVDCALRQGMTVGETLDLPKQHLLRNLYASEFQSFIKNKLIEEAQVRLGLTGLSEEERNGLGEAFCLTNPRLRDHPIVLVSDGFTKLTGYSAKFIVGRNCRMLAGPATPESASKRIRRALDRGEGINTLILNYRRDGSPFWNLLCIIPLRSKSGETTYFIGGQTEVTGTLASTKSLAFLVGSDRDPSLIAVGEDEISPSFKAYQDGLTLSSLNNSAGLELGDRLRRTVSGPAAGEITESEGTESRMRLQRKGLARLFLGSTKRKPVVPPKVPTWGVGQQIGGAEALYANETGPVDAQISKFADVYQKIVIFRRENREVIFATRPFLEFCGSPTRYPVEIYGSPILHADMLALIVAPLNGDYKKVRRQLKDTIAAGRPISLHVGIKVNQGGKWKATPDAGAIRYCALHATPLKDGEGVAEAFAVIFS